MSTFESKAKYIYFLLAHLYGIVLWRLYLIAIGQEVNLSTTYCKNQNDSTGHFSETEQATFPSSATSKGMYNDDGHKQSNSQSNGHRNQLNGYSETSLVGVKLSTFIIIRGKRQQATIGKTAWKLEKYTRNLRPKTSEYHRAGADTRTMTT